jgi:5'-nucleotidase / UDP-sugar diphosphatase
VKRSVTLSVAAAALCSCIRISEQPHLAGQDLSLTVLHTSDLHSRLLPYYASPGLIDRNMGLCAELQPLGGAARLQYLLKRERAKSDRVIHLDSGDCFQGAPIFNEFKGEAEVKVMNALRPDAVVVGNHEFDLGAKNLQLQYERFGNGAYPLLAANYLFSEPSDPFGNGLAGLIKPYEILNLEGLKIAVIGMGNSSSMNSIRHGGNSSGITPLEPVEILREWVNILHNQVDLVLVVSHMGLSARSEINLAEDTEVITGYDRVLEPEAVPSCFVCPADRAALTANGVAHTCPAEQQRSEAQDCWTFAGVEPDAQLRFHVPGVRGVDAIFGGHLHIVLNPPKKLIDPAGREVLLVHSGAFAKFFGRADFTVRMPKKDEVAPWGPEIVAHSYEVFPITQRIPKGNPSTKSLTPLAVVDCPDAQGTPTTKIESGLDVVGAGFQCLPLFSGLEEFEKCEKADECRILGDACTDKCRTARRDCKSVPAPTDAAILELLSPYVIELYQNVDLNRHFAFATERITRFGQSGEDSPLGNLVADSMRLRNRVEAQFALTNSLGIRTNMEEGAVSIEDMFNIFPFENTLTTMFLSGVEVQELFDYVTERSTERGCQSQAQISGATFTMNCAQALRNLDAPECSSAQACQTLEWSKEGTEKSVRCRDGRCYKSPADDIRILGNEVIPTESYKATVNDYIARGGSGFDVLGRNTTKINTGLSMRDALIDYMKAPPQAVGGGPGRVCGSKFMIGDIPRPTQPLLIYDKSTNPNLSCDARPTGCEEPSGRFIDCTTTDTEIKFYCIPHDFREISDEATCAKIDKESHFIQEVESEEAAKACQALPKSACAGQIHCCPTMQADGHVTSKYYCMTSYCIDPLPTGRITRVIK